MILFKFLFFSILTLSAMAETCTPGPPNYKVFVPKTLNIVYPISGSSWSRMSLQDCSMQASRYGYSTFWWIPESGNLCQTTHMSQDSYTDYDPTSTNLKIYVSKQQQLSLYNYRLVSIGNNNNTEISTYGHYGSYRVQAYMDRFFRNPLLINNSVADYGVLDFEGATFNQVTKVLAVCGGKQSVLGSTNSTKCYYLLTNVGSFDIGPWKGPLSMYQGRQEPIVVACRRLIYIFGGLVSDGAADRFEVLDTDDGSLTPLKGSNGSLVNQSSLTNIRMACAVGLDDTNEIVIAGGYISGVGVTTNVFLLNLNSKLWTKLPSMNTARWYHACSVVPRFQQSHLVVIGGTNSANVSIDTTELYNLMIRPSSWVIDVNKPPTMGNLVGSAIIQYDEKGCSAMMASSSKGTVYACSGYYSWTPTSLTKVNGIMVKMDINLFMI